MKKIICIALVLLTLLGCLTACNFMQNASDNLTSTAEATSEVEEMMAAMAENRTSDTKALMHPQIAETSDSALTQMISYLDGRNTESLELESINISVSTGTSGKIRQEEATYQATLTDGTVIYISVVYLSNNVGSGFIAFQLLLGFV